METAAKDSLTKGHGEEAPNELWTGLYMSRTASAKVVSNYYELFLGGFVPIGALYWGGPTESIHRLQG